MARVPVRGRSRLMAVGSAAAVLLGLPSPIGLVDASSTPGISIAWEHPIPADTGVAAIQAMAPLGSDVIVAGQISGAVPGGTSRGGGDVWVARYTVAGDLVWITQFGTSSTDSVVSLAASGSGIYVGGWTLGQFEEEPFDANRDYVARLTTGGVFEWARETQQSNNPGGAHVAVAPNGEPIAFLSEYISGATGSGFIGSLRRYAVDGQLRWERQIPACCGPTQPLASVDPVDIAGDPGGVMVAGFSAGSVEPDSMPDATAYFVRRYGYDGSVRWTSYIGQDAAGPAIAAVESSEAGVWISGVSQHPITGEPDVWPDPNPFLRRVSDAGVVAWTKAIGVEHTARDCAAILVTRAVAPTADPPHGPGAIVSRLHADGTEDWRFELSPDVDHLVAFSTVARTPGGVFLGIERENQAYSIAALNGAPASADCDAHDPSVAAPAARFVIGSTITSTVPVRLSWSAQDSGSGLAGFDVLERIDATPWRTVSERQLRAWADVRVRFGHDERFAIRAVDRSSRSALAIGPTMWVARHDDLSVQATYQGTWRTVPAVDAAGGSTHASSSAGASASFTFTGRAVGWIAPVRSIRGSARIYLDGAYAGTVNLAAPSYLPRRVVFVRSWSSGGRHTIRIVVIGTAGHPRVDVDGFVTLE